MPLPLSIRHLYLFAITGPESDMPVFARNDWHPEICLGAASGWNRFISLSRGSGHPEAGAAATGLTPPLMGAAAALPLAVMPGVAPTKSGGSRSHTPPD